MYFYSEESLTFTFKHKISALFCRQAGRLALVELRTRRIFLPKLMPFGFIDNPWLGIGVV